MSASTPKPPDGYRSWLDAAVGLWHPTLNGEICRVAEEELAALRARLRAAETTVDRLSWKIVAVNRALLETDACPDGYGKSCAGASDTSASTPGNDPPSKLSGGSSTPTPKDGPPAPAGRDTAASPASDSFRMRRAGMVREILDLHIGYELGRVSPENPEYAATETVRIGYQDPVWVSVSSCLDPSVQARFVREAVGYIVHRCLTGTTMQIVAELREIHRLMHSPDYFDLSRAGGLLAGLIAVLSQEQP